VLLVDEFMAVTPLAPQYPTASPTEEPTAAPTAAPTEEPTAVSDRQGVASQVELLT
jgi:hypothetical protein